MYHKYVLDCTSLDRYIQAQPKSVTIEISCIIRETGRCNKENLLQEIATITPYGKLLMRHSQKDISEFLCFLRQQPLTLVTLRQVVSNQ